MEAAGPGVGGAGPPAALSAGWIQEDVGAEFPQVALLFTEVHASSGRSPGGVKDRLRGLRIFDISEVTARFRRRNDP